MKSRPDYFENIANFGIPIFLIYVIDEKCLLKMQNPEVEKPVSILKK
jgi:hypothetical protein